MKGWWLVFLPFMVIVVLTPSNSSPPPPLHYSPPSSLPLFLSLLQEEDSVSIVQLTTFSESSSVEKIPLQISLMVAAFLVVCLLNAST